MFGKKGFGFDDLDFLATPINKVSQKEFDRIEEIIATNEKVVAQLESINKAWDEIHKIRQQQLEDADCRYSKAVVENPNDTLKLEQLLAVYEIYAKVYNETTGELAQARKLLVKNKTVIQQQEAILKNVQVDPTLVDESGNIDIIN